MQNILTLNDYMSMQNLFFTELNSDSDGEENIQLETTQITNSYCQPQMKKKSFILFNKIQKTKYI